MKSDYYIYEVPIITDRSGVKGPKHPKHIGGRAVLYKEETVIWAFTIGGHNYLKNRKYANLIAIISEDLFDSYRKEFLGEESMLKIPKNDDSSIGLKGFPLPTDSKPSKLWEFNEECPECGRKADHQIRACETGLSYCSKECRKYHVNKNAPPGGYQKNG